MYLQDRIIIDPAIHYGGPIIRSMRLPIIFVLGSLAAVVTFEKIQREYDISADQFRAALSYVTQILARNRPGHRALTAA